MASQSLRILLIADDPEVIRRIGEGLQRQDSGLILIEGADSLATARRRLGAGAYDLALIDLAVGEGDGLHLLSELREVAPDLPLVALAANGSGPDADACLAVGAQDRLAVEAMGSAGLLDRLRCATARARVGSNSQRRTQRIAASLGSAGDLAWHYEQDAGDVWLTAADPAAWQLPGPESRESLDSLKARIHPDDRELVVRRVEEMLESDQPWLLDARIRLGGGAYRWVSLRGQAQHNARGQLERAAGMLSDAQRQYKQQRELEQGRRFLRAVFDSHRVPHAALNSAGVITECNQAWRALDEAVCHAGKAFEPGRRFIDPPGELGAHGDLDISALARGVKQVLGGVVEQFRCEYGDGEGRRWRIVVNPLLNPGIAGAVVSHEEITELTRGERELKERLAELEDNARALAGALFRLAPDFTVLGACDTAAALSRAPVVGRDILKVLPRPHAEAVGDALAALTGGARAVVRDSSPEDGPAFRWLVSTRHDAQGNGAGYLVHGIDVSDLISAVPAEAGTAANESAEMTGLRAALAAVEQQRATARQELLDAQRALGAANARSADLEGQIEKGLGQVEALRTSLARLEAEREELKAGLEEVRRESEQARQLVSEVEQENDRLTRELEGERTEHGKTRAGLADAEEGAAALRAELERARQKLRADLDALVDQILRPLLARPGAEPAPQPRQARHRKG